MFKKRGVRRVRPLSGGFEGWRKAGLPTELVLRQTDLSERTVI